MSSDFSESKNWTRVNDFTLRGPSVAGGEPAFHKCLPNDVDLVLRDLRLEYRVEWTGSWVDEGETPEHRVKTIITARGEIESGVITAFLPGFGVVQRLGEIRPVTIEPISTGGVSGLRVGGRRNATVADGIMYPHEQEVPPGGLMDGELGRIFYEGYVPDKGKTANGELYARLFIEEEAFDSLIDALRSGYTDIASAKASVIGDFFQTELSAYMGEPGLFEEFGMMLSASDKNSAIANARLENLALRWKTQHKEVPDEVYEGNDKAVTEYEEASAQDRIALRVVSELKAISKFQKIMAVALALIFLLLLKELWG